MENKLLVNDEYSFNTVTNVYTHTLDKTWREIFNAFPNVTIRFNITKDPEVLTTPFDVYEDGYERYCVLLPEVFVNCGDGLFVCSSKDDYPELKVQGNTKRRKIY